MAFKLDTQISMINLVKIFPLVGSLLFVFLLACQPNERSKSATSENVINLQETLPGTWEVIALKVQINSFMNTDSSYVFEVKEENWEEKLGVRPKRTVYSLDNRYRAEFRNLSDELVNLQRGVWNVFSDTLMMIEADATYQYRVTLRQGLADFTTMVDWDGDGIEDDNYLETHRYVGKDSE